MLRPTPIPQTGPVDLREESRRHMPSIPELPHLREAAIQTWRGRMINEYSSNIVFEALARQLEQAGLDAERVATCRSFAAEERRHGVLCGAVVEALGGEAVFHLRPEEAYPEHEHVSRVEAALYNVLSISCMSETVAVALVGAERLEVPHGELRDLLTSIYADEVGHARFGWKLVPELLSRLEDGARERLQDYLALAFAALEQHELAHLNPFAAPPAEGVSVGLCNGRDARGLFYATVHEVIVPGLERLGLPASHAWKHRHEAPVETAA